MTHNNTTINNVSVNAHSAWLKHHIMRVKYNTSNYLWVLPLFKLFY